MEHSTKNIMVKAATIIICLAELLVVVVGAEREMEFTCLPDVEHATDPKLSPSSPNLSALFNTCNVDHRVFCPGSYTLTPPEPNGLLNVFLHGTTAPPRWHSSFLRLSAERGFHTLGLAWPSLSWSTNSSASYCEKNEAGSSTCLYDMHRQLLIGGVREDGVPDYWAVSCPAPDGTCEKGDNKCCTGDYIADVPKEGSIVGLVAAAIAQGGHKWTRHFFDKDGAIRWNKVVFSGHSQGANMAAFAAIYLTAEHGSVAGLSLLSGPKGLWKPPAMSNVLGANRWVFNPEDYFFSSRNGKPLSWSDLKVKAVASDFEKDVITNGMILDAWEAMDLGYTHDLSYRDNGNTITTKKIPNYVAAVTSPLDFSSFANVSDEYHVSMAIDCFTPRANPYPGNGGDDTPAVYAQKKGVWSWVLAEHKSRG